MDDTTPKEPDPSEASSSEYRLRFRYELWSQASLGFRSPAALKRFASIVVNGTASTLDGRTAELENASESYRGTDRRGVR